MLTVKQALNNSYGQQWVQEIAGIINEYDETRNWKIYNNKWGYGLFVAHYLVKPSPVTIGVGENAYRVESDLAKASDDIIRLFEKKLHTPTFFSKFIFENIKNSEQELPQMVDSDRNILIFNLVRDNIKKLIIAEMLIDGLYDFYMGLSNKWKEWLNSPESGLRNDRDPVAIWHDYAAFNIARLREDIENLIGRFSSEIFDTYAIVATMETYDIGRMFHSEKFVAMKNQCVKCDNVARFSCGKCSALYCGKKCQAQDWDDHQKHCS